jgi:putative ABC transport system ATP-binding protein
MTSIISTEKICREFKSGRETVHALKNVSITVEQRALTILRGRSGSGKTTLINMLGAMDHPTSGKIYFNDTEITSISEIKRDELRRKQIGFVFQSGALITNMTAFENVDFGLRIAGFEAKDRKKRAEECLSIVGLSKRMEHFPYELSGGEAQRVAIARAIAHKPKVIFADEPTAALDTNMGLQVVKTFKDMVEKEGITVVMTTHDPNMIEIADYVYTLQDGEVVYE